MALIDVMSQISDDNPKSKAGSKPNAEVATGPASNTANEWSFDAVTQAIDAMPRDF